MFNIDTHLILPSLLWPDVTLVNNNYRASKAPGSALRAPLMAAIDLPLFCFRKSSLFEVQETSGVGICTTSSTYFYEVIQRLFTGEPSTQAAPQWQHTNEVRAKAEQGTEKLLTVNSSA